MSKLKDRIEKLMDGHDVAEMRWDGPDTQKRLWQDLMSSMTRLSLLKEGIKVDFLMNGEAIRISRTDVPLPPNTRWSDLKAAILAKIEAIDKDTPWSETEPGWWLEMQEVKRLLNK